MCVCAQSKIIFFLFFSQILTTRFITLGTRVDGRQFLAAAPLLSALAVLRAFAHARALAPA